MRDFNFSYNELPERNERLMQRKKNNGRRYRNMVKEQLKMLVENSVLIRSLIEEESKGLDNCYYTRPLNELDAEYEQLKIKKHTHRAHHIFDVMYWRRQRYIE